MVGGKIQNFTDLVAWKEGHKLVILTYKLTRSFPHEEMFGLVSQLRRCVVSITSNIAEGFSRISYKEKVQFYATSLGSITELQNQFIIAKDVGLIKDSDFAEVSGQSLVVHKLVNGLIKSTKSRSN